MKIEVIKGDITELEVDAIVNPANSFGFMGGGVAAAIKIKGGLEIEREAISHAPIPVGTAILTTAGNLKADYIIHAPTMARPAQKIYLDSVEDATRAALDIADKNNLKTIAIPGMGTGVGGIPKEKAAESMLKIIKNFQENNIKKLILVAFDDELVKAFNSNL